MNQKISIIVPIYNSEMTLERTLDSLINQSYTNLEIILVNDGSTDNSLEICKKYASQDNRIIILNQKNKGVGIARNNGINKSTGDFISFVDSDDVLDNDYFTIVLQKANESGADVVGANIRVIRNNEILYPYNFLDYKEYENCEVLKQYLNFKINTAIWGKLYSKNILAGIKFDNININEDFIFSWEVMKKTKKFVQINSTSYTYYIDNVNSLSKQKFGLQNMSIITHAINVLNQSEKFNNSEIYKCAINYFYGCVLHNFIKYVDDLKYQDDILKYKEEENIMINILKNENYKLNFKNGLLDYESSVNIDNLIKYIEKLNNTKGNTKCI